MSKRVRSIFILILSIILVGSVSITLLTSKKSKSVYYDEMVNASTLTKESFEIIKKYKTDNNIEISEKDSLKTGLIGPSYSYTCSGGGEIDAKLTSTNYNFAALYIKYFKNVGLKDNDEVAMLFSGSFPALNIAALCAAYTLNLKVCIMASISGSNYGSIDKDFNFIDMFYVLKVNNLFPNYTIDMYSPGSHDDNGTLFYDVDKDYILNRLNTYGYEYKEITNYTDNVNYRIDYIKNKLPNLKLFVNVGAQTLGVGKNECDRTTNTTDIGLIKGRYKPNEYEGNKNIGLIDYYLNRGIDVIHMLKLKTLCNKEGLLYNPLSIPDIGQEDVYYDKTYNLFIPIIGLSLTFIGLTYYYLDKKKIVKFNKK